MNLIYNELIAMNLINNERQFWSRLSQYLEFFLHPQIPGFQIVVSWPNIIPIITSHAAMESLLIQLSDYV